MTIDFLGRGFAFPLSLGPDGDVSMVDSDEDIRQAIRLILETEPGERVMRPDFGAGLRGMTFAPITTTNLALFRSRVEEALVTSEPRIELEQVTVDAAEAVSGRILIRIDYRVRATNSFYNLVFPYYLREGRP